MDSSTSKQEAGDVEAPQAAVTVVGVPVLGAEPTSDPKVDPARELDTTTIGEETAKMMEVPSSMTTTTTTTNPCTTTLGQLDRTISAITSLYVATIIVLFAGPPIIWATATSEPNESSPDHPKIQATIELVIVVGIIALIVTIVGLVITIHRWSRLSTGSKVVGLLPSIVTCVPVIGFFLVLFFS